jgi:hypothetical protein
MYAVFQWEDGNDVSVVSQRWIVKEDRGTFCYWPPVDLSGCLNRIKSKLYANIKYQSLIGINMKGMFCLVQVIVAS